jgi:hypothetical protein
MRKVMKMRDEIELIMYEHGEQFKLISARTHTLSWASYPAWRGKIHGRGNALEKIRDDIKALVSDRYTTAAKYSAGGARNAVSTPWVSIRPNGGETSKDRMNTRFGMYVNYLFSQDGQECYLVLGIATTSLKEIHGHNTPDFYKALQRINNGYRTKSSTNISLVKSKIGTRLNDSNFKLASDSGTSDAWGEACPFHIRYEKGNIPSQQMLEEDLKLMVQLYDAIAESFMPRNLNEIMNELQLSGIVTGNNIVLDNASIPLDQIKCMIRSFSICPYRYPIEDINHEYQIEHWMTITKNSSFLELESLDDKNIVSWKVGSQSTDGEELIRVVRCYRNVIIEGPPGVGKTHFFDELRKEFKENVTFLTFHPSTEYGDFIGGLRPAISQKLGKDSLEFKSTRGFLLKALEQTKSGKTLLWIDEINRGNVAKIFGELIGLIGTNNPQSPTIRNAGLDKGLLDMSKNGGIVLDNLHIVGTINTADRSISHLDSAIRRRFKFVRLHPNLTISAISSLSVIQQFEHINNLLNEKYGSDGMLGHSYLFELKDNPGREENIWKYSILPNIADIIMREGTESAEEVIEDINAHVPVDWKLKKRGKSYSAIVEVVYKEVE